jgi:cell division protein FtsI/penicillin-binding protein 2
MRGRRSAELTFSTKRRRRFLRVRTLVVVLVVAALATGAVVIFRSADDDGPPPLPASEVDAFLAAWTAGKPAPMAALLDKAPRNLDGLANSLVKAVPGSKATYDRMTVDRAVDDDNDAVATYHARVDVEGFGPIEWDGTMHLTRVTVERDGDEEEVWRIVWAPDLLYPGLRAGERLGVRVTWPQRGTISAADGTRLAGPEGTITIGLRPSRVGDSLQEIKTTLQSLLGTDPADVDAALADPDAENADFVAVATVPDGMRYEQTVRPQLAPLPGVFFRREGGVVPSDPLMSARVGRVGEITAELLKELGPPYRAGDLVGLSGLQRAFEKRLAGAPTRDIVVEKGNTTIRRITRFPGTKARNVRLTLDARIQRAADSALANVTQPAALVAIDATTGQIRAAVSKPDGGFDRALAGRYEPGSTFKIITSAALLEAGNTGSTPAPCPAILTVHGRPFRNFEGEASNTLDLANAFKVSCNNSFIGLADRLPDNALMNAAARFGFNAEWSLPVESTGGSFPEPSDRAELAASAIGQGRVLASPMHMASVAATVASGQWRVPALTSEPKPKPVKVPALSANTLATLRSFMASTVQPGGTASGAGLPPGTYGKTGTAEFGSGNPPPTHAWFVGFRGSLAFAVVVEGGGVGGRVAAPLAAAFLRAVG